MHVHMLGELVTASVQSVSLCSCVHIEECRWTKHNERSSAVASTAKYWASHPTKDHTFWHLEHAAVCRRRHG